MCRPLVNSGHERRSAAHAIWSAPAAEADGAGPNAARHRHGGRVHVARRHDISWWRAHRGDRGYLVFLRHLDSAIWRLHHHRERGPDSGAAATSRNQRNRRHLDRYQSWSLRRQTIAARLNLGYSVIRPSGRTNPTPSTCPLEPMTRRWRPCGNAKIEG